MPEGSDQNQENQGVGGTGAPTQPEAAPASPGGFVDGVNGASSPESNINLGPNQITPNLAREETYFGEPSAAPAPQAAPVSPEMQYPSYTEENESTFSPKLILIIFAVGVILLGSIGGIIYFFNSRTNVEEEIILEEDAASGDESAESESNSEETSPTAVPEVPAPKVTEPAATPTPAPVETPIVAPQPEEKTPDTSGAVEGSG